MSPQKNHGNILKFVHLKSRLFTIKNTSTKTCRFWGPNGHLLRDTHKIPTPTPTPQLYLLKPLRISAKIWLKQMGWLLGPLKIGPNCPKKETSLPKRERNSLGIFTKSTGAGFRPWMTKRKRNQGLRLLVAQSSKRLWLVCLFLSTIPFASRMVGFTLHSFLKDPNQDSTIDDFSRHLGSLLIKQNKSRCGL